MLRKRDGQEKNRSKNLPSQTAPNRRQEPLYKCTSKVSRSSFQNATLWKYLGTFSPQLGGFFPVRGKSLPSRLLSVTLPCLSGELVLCKGFKINDTHSLIKILLIFHVRNIFKVDFETELCVVISPTPSKYFHSDGCLRRIEVFLFSATQFRCQ